MRSGHVSTAALVGAGVKVEPISGRVGRRIVLTPASAERALARIRDRWDDSVREGTPEAFMRLVNAPSAMQVWIEESVEPMRGRR